MPRAPRLVHVCAFVLIACQPRGVEPTTSAEPEVVEPPPRDPEAELDAFAGAVAAAMTDKQIELGLLPPALAAPAESVWVCLRADGEKLVAGWSMPELATGPLVWHVLLDAIQSARATLTPAEVARVTSVEIEVMHDRHRFDIRDPAQLEEFLDVDEHGIPRNMGIRGEILVVEGHEVARPPTAALTENHDRKTMLRGLRDLWRLSDAQWAAGTYSTFTSDQVLVELGDPAKATAMFRGNQLVPLEAVDAASVETLASLAAQWLITNTDEHGRITYLYAPSTRTESDKNNAIRQWNASHALLAWAERVGDPALFELSRRNIEHNLALTFHFEDELGVIELNGKKKLGAFAVAGLALARHPEHDHWTAELTGLRATIDNLWRSDGSFVSLLGGQPSSSASFWNFYPGEVLLLWATLARETKDPELLRKYRRSFEFYRDWHHENLSPTFAPWHLRANEIMLADLAGSDPEFEAELREFCFELGDLLVSFQQRDGAPIHPDEYGRFYDPLQRWGSPEAESTGIYVWSLVSAFRLARAAGDHDRQQRYREAIVAGLRSLMQLQFVDEVDMFYVPVAERPRVRGGLRRRVSDNEIRVDHVHYALLAALDVLDTFAPNDYPR